MLHARLFLECGIANNLEIVLSPRSPFLSAESKRGRRESSLPLHLLLRETKCSDVHVKYRNDDEICRLGGIHEKIRSDLGFVPSSVLEFSTSSINPDLIKALHDSGKFFLGSGISSYSIISRVGSQTFVPFLGFSAENNKVINYFGMINLNLLALDYYFMLEIVDRLMAVK